MARIAGGMGDLEWARSQVANARTAEDLRQAQAVLLPLELGLSLGQTASAIGRSVSMTCKLRNRRRREFAQELEPKKHKRQLRNHAHARLLPAFKAALGKNLSLSTLYRMLARHGWRKLAPDTVHPQGNPERREDFKKNSSPTWRKL